MLRHSECVMHYLINTNAAVWLLQDDLLVLSRPVKQTLSQIICTKRADRCYVQEHILLRPLNGNAGIHLAKIRYQFKGSVRSPDMFAA